MAKGNNAPPQHIAYAMDVVVKASEASKKPPTVHGHGQGRIPFSDDGLGTFRKQIKGLPAALRIASDPSLLEPPATIVSSRGNELPFPILDNGNAQARNNIAHLKKFNKK